MEKTWILVANASHATLYGYTPSKNTKPALTLIKEFNHSDSRKKDSDLVSDREGQYRAGAGHGNFVEASDPHQHEALVFARELFHKLEQGRTAHQYEELMLVAGPHFLGLLRQCIDERPLNSTHIHEVHKDYSQEKSHDLPRLLNLK